MASGKNLTRAKWNVTLLTKLSSGTLQTRFESNHLLINREPTLRLCHVAEKANPQSDLAIGE
jgi:hypothetical protein